VSRRSGLPPGSPPFLETDNPKLSTNPKLRRNHLPPAWPQIREALQVISPDARLKPPMELARQSRNQRSAEWYSAVSRIGNPPAAAGCDGFAIPGAPPDVIRRYSRLQICATPEDTRREKFARKSKTFSDNNAAKIEKTHALSREHDCAHLTSRNVQLFL
jgi:hypothetical protein